MALLPSTDLVASYTGELFANFNYFSRPIVIYKEPIQNIVSSPQNYLYGYDVSQTQNSEVTFTNVSATYSGIMIYPFKNKNNTSDGFIDNKIALSNNNIYIKVKSDARNYIKDGRKVEKIEVDGNTYNLVEGYKDQIQTYLGLQFYYFEVKGTN